jgi:hypothetical protein
MSGVKRAFAKGAMSEKAFSKTFRKYLGSTSNDGKALTADGGGARQYGAICGDHIEDAEYVAPRRGSGFTNPTADYGRKSFAARDHIDRDKPSSPRAIGRGKETSSTRASVARALRGSASEWNPNWYRTYGDGPRR